MLSPTSPAWGRDRFLVCLRETLHHEGGWSNDRYDSGGPTMRGVIQRVYDAWRDSQGLARRSVRLIEEGEYLAIYRQNYWVQVRADELAPGVDLAVFDFGVNSGPVQAIKSLQRVIGVTIDGHFGAATMAALQRRNDVDLIRAYLAERRRFYRGLDTFWRFGKGWLARADAVESTAIGMSQPLDYGAADHLPPAQPPLADPDAQAATQGRATPTDPKPPRSTELTLGATGTTSIGTGIAQGVGKIAALTASGKPVTFLGMILTFASEPLVMVGAVTVFGALTTYLWRRRFA